MVRIGQSLERYRDVKLQQFRSRLAMEDAHLANHLVEMLDSALTKYRTWLERNLPVGFPADGEPGRFKEILLVTRYSRRKGRRHDLCAYMMVKPKKIVQNQEQ
ncbi:General transcription factor IIH subunit 1 [Desmophyllum pertusum]|uniref:General transcription factor IIH subunit 1 n=1 Tax=Desmophyllum pertusum TaxID=174260 RepID=A0A9W9YTV2_9CNID|nr:General transcription factor IIH subunit 1 [Desmophyllum pertusum]